MDDDEFGADPEFLAALAASDVGAAGASAGAAQASVSRPTPAPASFLASAVSSTAPPGALRPTTTRVMQPTPQRMGRPMASAGNGGTIRVVQPTPQALPGGVMGVAGEGSSSGTSAGNNTSTGADAATPLPRPVSGATILVSPRQKGNPILAQLRSVPWEYSDIPADYQMGATVCALFLSLKYHRLHPEYIYARIQRLRGAFRMRVLLALVDMDNHEESLRELAKTSLVNRVTLVLSWSATEAAHYLELYKAFEHATGFAAIRGPQAGGGGAAAYAEQLVQFCTVPRAVHKADAVALVSAFSSLRRAVLADPEQLALVPGWGSRKVQSWRRAVEAPFRVRKGATARRDKAKGREKENKNEKEKQKVGTAAAAGIAGSENSNSDRMARMDVLDHAISIGSVPLRDMPGSKKDARKDGIPGEAATEQIREEQPDRNAKVNTQYPAEELSDGVAMALAHLRKMG